MMKKRMFGAAVVFAVLMTQICTFASYTTYSIRNGEAVFSDTDCADKKVSIESSFEGFEVTGIGVNAFKDNENIEKAELPATITFIEWGAFENCRNLKEITIPEKVAMIEDMTFAGCEKLETVNLPKNLVFVGVKAFAGTALRNVVIPDGVKAIDAKAFENCNQLRTITLPDSVEYIADDAFNGCDNLVVNCTKGSYAEKYMKANDMEYVVK